MNCLKTFPMCRVALVTSITMFILTSAPLADAQMVYWADYSENAIRRAQTDGSGIELLVSGTDAAEPTDLTLDLRAGKIYWCANSPDSVRRANLDGTNVEILTTTGVDFPNGIALDGANDHMYVTSYANNQINRYNLDGSGYTAIHTFPASSGPRGIDLDLEAGKMYYQLQGVHRIERSDLDGANIESVVDPTGAIPHDLTLDTSGGKVYWVELGTDTIRRCNLNGANLETVVATGDRPRGLALDLSQGKLWWTKPGSSPLVIRRSNLDGSGIETIVSGTPLQDPWGITIDSRVVVYDNGYTDPASDTGNEMSGWVQTDDFELASPTNLSGVVIDWFELIEGSWDGQAQWYIFSDNAGAPGTLLHQGNGINRSTVSLGTYQGWYWHQTELGFDSEITLATATRYWVGLHWKESGNFVQDDVYWAATAAGGFGTTGQESSGGAFTNWNITSHHRSFRMLGGEPCGLFCDGFESMDITPWSNATGYLHPNYDVFDGPHYSTNPPVYSCLEACALVFGGIPGDYQCSTSNAVINNQANASTWGLTGCQLVAENYSLDQGSGYHCGSAGCATSAYVQDNCGPGGINYCWPQ